MSKADRLLYHPTLDSRVIKKKKRGMIPQGGDLGQIELFWG